MDGELKQEYVLPVTASKSGLVFMDVYDMNVRGEYSSGSCVQKTANERTSEEAAVD